MNMELLSKICEVLEDEEVLEKMKTTSDLDWIMEKSFHKCQIAEIGKAYGYYI